MAELQFQNPMESSKLGPDTQTRPDFPRKLSILSLEDNATDADLIRESLETEGFELELRRVEEEGDFRMALQTWHPDLIISDYSLPSYNGLDALKTARSLRPEVPFIFYTGTIGEQQAIDAVKLGATDYVLKDRPRRLVTAVQRALYELEGAIRQKQAEARLLSQAQLIDLATDAIIVRDLEDPTIFWSKGAERLYGYTEQEVLGRKSTDFIRPDYLKLFQEAKTTTLQDGKWEGELEYVAKDGRPILVTSRWTLVRDVDGEPERILVIHSDITEKRKVESQLLRAQRLECVGTLASGVAHDLNNVLAPILMGAELLQSYELEEEVKALIETISRSAHRGADVIRQLLMFVRGAEGRRTQIKLVHLLRDAQNMASTTFPKSISVSCEAAPDLWPVIGDPTQIHQVLMNLCINARDAMPQGGKLQLKARNVPRDEGGHRHVAITVGDSGFGMQPEVLEKIFDPFFTTKPLGKGTGLGLPTVLGIIQSHGGTIHVSSQPDQGTTFELLLPAEDPAVSLEQSSAQRSTPKGNGELILVVDDEPEIRRVMAQVLMHSGYDVITASDGNAGVLRFVESKDSIRLVITDMMMPGADGETLAKAVRAVKPGVRILATSGVSNHRNVPQAEFLLKKPFSSEELLHRVHEALTAEAG